MASLASESTPQASTLRRHFCDLIRAIEDPVLLAVDLYSANIITQTMLERVTDVPSLTRTDKTSLLLGAVSDQTVVSPATFDGFLSILSDDHGALVPDIVEEMKVPMPAPAGTLMRKRKHSPSLGQTKKLRMAFAQAILGGEKMQGKVGSRISQSVHSPFLRYVLTHQPEHLKDTVPVVPSAMGTTHPSDPGTSSLSKQQAVKQLVHDLESEFFLLSDATRQAVNSSGITLSQFCMLLTQIPVSMKDDRNTVRYFKDNIRVFNQSSNIDEIFYHLNLYWDFLNYGLLEHIISRLENRVLEQEMERYVAKLSTFRTMTTLREFSDAWHHKVQKIPRDLKQLVTKHNESWMDRTLEEVERFRQKFSVKFSLSRFALILVRIENGSVLITWLIPTSVIPHLKDQLQDSLQQLQQEYEDLEVILDGRQLHPYGSFMVPAGIPTNQGVGDVHLLDRLWQHLTSTLLHLLPMLAPDFYPTLIRTCIGEENGVEARDPQATTEILLILLTWVVAISSCYGFNVASGFAMVRSLWFSIGVLVGMLLVCFLLYMLALLAQKRAMWVIAPLMHFLGCFVGTIIGVHFNCLGVNGVSGCLLGIICVALIIRSITRLQSSIILPFGVLVGVLAYSVGSVFLSSVLFGTVGWYHHGLVIGLSLFAILCGQTEYDILQEDDQEDDQEDNQEDNQEDDQEQTGSKVLYFTCRMLGVAIAGFSLPLCTKLVDLMLQALAKDNVEFPLHFIQRMCWYAPGIVRRIIPAGLISLVYRKLIWTMLLLAWISFGSALGELCGQAVLMLAGQSRIEQVAGGSLMVSGGVIGALAGYSILGVGVGVPAGVDVLVGILVGSVVPSIILLKRGGFNFKSYFLKTNFLLLGSLQKLFARFGF